MLWAFLSTNGSVFPAALYGALSVATFSTGKTVAAITTVGDRLYKANTGIISALAVVYIGVGLFILSTVIYSEIMFYLAMLLTFGGLLSVTSLSRKSARSVRRVPEASANDLVSSAETPVSSTEKRLPLLPMLAAILLVAIGASSATLVLVGGYSPVYTIPSLSISMIGIVLLFLIGIESLLRYSLPTSAGSSRELLQVSSGFFVIAMVSWVVTGVMSLLTETTQGALVNAAGLVTVFSIGFLLVAGGYSWWKNPVLDD